jgi:hypothetical protein
MGCVKIEDHYKKIVKYPAYPIKKTSQNQIKFNIYLIDLFRNNFSMAEDKLNFQMGQIISSKNDLQKPH